ncbi:MAG: hypothetical protein HOP10_10505 [Chitinophagaceae bacterium]|nr:hypothetical protein [Chitinophagaceae bacterium]
MTQRNNILQELNELNSTLVNVSTGNIYSVPAGYFDGLAATMLNRIKAMDAANTVEELNHLSPLLNTISKQNIYSVPVGYFERLAENAMRSAREGNEYQTAKEEIESLSPLLSGLKKENPYSVPQEYFESIDIPFKPATKVVSITHRKWFRYAAAAMVIGIITMTGVLIFGNEEKKQAKSLAKFEKKLNNEIKTMSDNDLQDFMQYTDAGLNGKETVFISNTNEAKELLKDIPESELKEFLEETADVDDTELTMMD